MLEVVATSGRISSRSLRKLDGASDSGAPDDGALENGAPGGSEPPLEALAGRENDGSADTRRRVPDGVGVASSVRWASSVDSGESAISTKGSECEAALSGTLAAAVSSIRETAGGGELLAAAGGAWLGFWGGPKAEGRMEGRALGRTLGCALSGPGANESVRPRGVERAGSAFGSRSPRGSWPGAVCF